MSRTTTTTRADYARFTIAAALLAALAAGLVWALNFHGPIDPHQATWLDRAMARFATPAAAATVPPEPDVLPGVSARQVDDVITAAQDPSAFIGDGGLQAPGGGADPQQAYRLITPATDVSGVSVPARWCPGTIPYTIDFTGTRGYEVHRNREVARWRDAFHRWTTASGGAWRFRYAGPANHPTDTIQQGLSYKVGNVSPGSIAITYATPTHPVKAYRNPTLSGAQANAGIGKVTFTPLADPTTTGIIPWGAVSVNITDIDTSPSRRAPRAHVHEIGHVLGLGHVDNPDAVMHPEAEGPHTPQRDDKEGVQRLLSVGCPS